MSYHIAQSGKKAGLPVPCHATIKCTLKDENGGDAPHFETEEEAIKHQNKQNSKNHGLLAQMHKQTCLDYEKRRDKYGERYDGNSWSGQGSFDFVEKENYKHFSDEELQNMLDEANEFFTYHHKDEDETGQWMASELVEEIPKELQYRKDKLSFNENGTLTKDAVLKYRRVWDEEIKGYLDKNNIGRNGHLQFGRLYEDDFEGEYSTINMKNGKLHVNLATNHYPHNFNDENFDEDDVKSHQYTKEEDVKKFVSEKLSERFRIPVNVEVDDAGW